LLIEAKFFPEEIKPRKKNEFFVDTQITQHFEDQNFNTKLNSTNGKAWKTSEESSRNFLGNVKLENYIQKVQELISSHSVMWGNAFENSFSAFKFGFLS
jgi:hypothetical protein